MGSNGKGSKGHAWDYEGHDEYRHTPDEGFGGGAGRGHRKRNLFGDVPTGDVPIKDGSMTSWAQGATTALPPGFGDSGLVRCSCRTTRSDATRKDKVTRLV